MRLLLTNDDGINAQGITTLAQALEEDGHQVFVVAPQGERSTCGHSMTLSKPFEVVYYGHQRWAVDGFPADCVLWAMNHLLAAQKIDAIIAGINNGGNMAQDLYYSGTVAAAREGMQLGIPSIAVSLVVSFAKLFKGPTTGHKVVGDEQESKKNKENKDRTHVAQQASSVASPNFAAVATWMAAFLKKKIKQSDFQDCFLNLNFPDCPLNEYQGIKAVRPGYIEYNKDITSYAPFRRKHFYWIGGDMCHPILAPQTDVWAVKNNYIAASWVKLAAVLAENNSTNRHAAKVWQKMFSSGITRK